MTEFNYRSPWGGDGSPPARTLVPWFNNEFAECPWPGWKFRRDLDGWQGVPHWAECWNGQTTCTVVPGGGSTTAATEIILRND